MLHTNQPRLVLLSLLVLAAASVGCNRRSAVTVTGTILKDGQPVALSQTGVLQVTLMPDIRPDETYTTRIGECDREGKFKIENVPPGKYKIGVEQFDPNPMTDKLKGAFATSNSKILRDVDGKAPLSIDLAKPE